MMCLWGLFGFFIFWASLDFLNLYTFFLHRVGDIFSQYFFKQVLYNFNLFSFRYLYDAFLLILDVVPGVP